MGKRRRWFYAGLLSALLAACGGGGGSGGAVDAGAPAAVEVVEPVGPGRTLAVTRINAISAAQITQALAATGSNSPLLTPRYDTVNYRIEYLTLDADAGEVRASGLLSVPTKPASARSPMLSYQHATIFHDADAPSVNVAPDQLPLVLASLGYVVVAADYVGYGASKGVPHPYLLSAPSASAVIDLLTAARNWRLRNRLGTNGQLFLAGYSEGGYVSMAAHRALQAGSSPQRDELVAAVTGAGPYNLTATLDAALQQVKSQSALAGALINPGFLSNLPRSVRDELRRAIVRVLVPDDADVAFDTRFINAYLADDSARIEAQSNVHDWKPEVAVRLFHGRQDQTVAYASSSSTLQAMTLRGARDVSLTDCAEQPSGHLECVPPYLAFLLARLSDSTRGL